MPGHAHQGGAVRAWAGLPALLLVAALLATGGAVFVISVSKISPHPVGQALLTAIVSLSFVGTGVVALRLQPYARFGLLLCAVGFTSLISVLHEANGAFAYTVGVLASNLVFAVLLHAFLAFPSGRLGSTGRRLLVAAAYVDVLALQALAVLFDPLTRYSSDHPRNLALVDSRSSLATGLEELEAAIAIALALAAVLVLFRRTRAATPAARRQLVPVFVGGTIALTLFSVGLVLAPLSSRAGLVGFALGLVAALALPAAFLGTLVQGRLSRGAVGELLLELRDPGRARDLQDALGGALGDPSLRLGRLGPEADLYLDCAGRPLTLPRPGDVAVTTTIRHQGESIGVLVHDRSLRLRQELLDAVTAAAGFALANERALHDAQLAEQRNRALLDAIPDTMLRVASDGTYLDIRPDEHTGQLGPAEEMIGRNVRDLLPDELATAVLSCIERTLESGSVNTIEYELPIRGVGHWKEARMVPSGDGEVVAISRDFTEERRAEAEQQRLAAEQAALRRVATLVAGNAAARAGVPDRDGGGLPAGRSPNRRAPSLRGRTNVDDRRQVRRADRAVRARKHQRARGGLGTPGLADRGLRPVELRRARRLGRGDAADTRVPRQHGRAHHGRRRDLGRPGRRAQSRRVAAARDRASPAGVRRARRPRGGERACAR